MSHAKRIVLDANILLRAVFGIRVRDLLRDYEDVASFFTPDVCLRDARAYIPVIASTRRFDPASGLMVLDQLARVVEIVDRDIYQEFETIARQRMLSRDEGDWPIAATCLLLDCPVWTEDQDFFGSGIATWTTNNVELFLRDA
uniref:PIN domain-containing protein n=1 Tax=mine drainage metagenome TaxID=410659 RepID=E6QIW4_9ZZZZ